MRVWFVVALAASACSDQKPAVPEPVAPPTPTPSDARPTMFGGAVGSASGMHLDEDPAIGPRPAQPTNGRHGQPIEIVLRSTPSGAMAAVDGVQVGTTPTNWSGTADGQPHEFTFTRSGYAFARYRFVPITSGVIHGRLEPIGEDADGGVPPAPEHVAPHQGSAFTPAPPLSIVAPVDAAPTTPTPPTTGAGPQP